MRKGREERPDRTDAQSNILLGIRRMDVGKLLVVLGIALVGAGVVVMLAGRMNLPVGRLPGDFLYRGKNTTVYFPWATSIVVSVVLSVVLYLVSRWRR